MVVPFRRCPVSVGVELLNEHRYHELWQRYCTFINLRLPAFVVPGVHSVLTGADVQGVLDGRRLRDVLALARERVRFAGERVAAVVAIGAAGVVVLIFFTGRRGRRLVGQAASGVRNPLVTKFALFLALSGFLVGLMVVTLPFLIGLGGPLGYTAGFFISLATSATIAIPSPGFAAILIMARELNPIWLGIAAGVGGTFGELSGYYAGSRGSGTLEGNRFHNIMRGYMDRAGGAVIFISGLVPVIPVDVAGLIAGSTRYPIRKFLFYLGIGKTIMTAATLYLAVRAFEWAEPFLGFLT